MRTLYLIRHSLTEGNARRLYYGWTDLPLSGAGIALARETRRSRPLPAFESCITSGMRRTNETLRLLTGHEPDAVLPDLREMNFGAFEMYSYEELKDDPDYRRWIDDCMGPGVVRCPGGESQSEFRERVLWGGQALLALPRRTALAVVHGGVIANLMAEWFPGEARNFYEWQPGPCKGYKIAMEGGVPAKFEEV